MSNHTFALDGLQRRVSRIMGRGGSKRHARVMRVATFYEIAALEENR